MDSLFGIDSPTALAEWAIEPSASSAVSSHEVATAGAAKTSTPPPGLSKAMAEALSKKLTGTCTIVSCCMVLVTLLRVYPHSSRIEDYYRNERATAQG